jgi:hypothetical protein
MISKRLLILAFLVFFISEFAVLAQSNKRYKGKKRTSRREIIKAQQSAQKEQASDSPFAPAKAFRPKDDLRDDQMWKSHTAEVIYPRAANLSLIEPSKYGISNRFQLESILPLMPLVPNMFGKYRWLHINKWVVSSRHGLMSAYPGFKYLQNNKQYVDSAARIPYMISTKNELIVSRYFSKAYGCNGRQPYLILSALAGFDTGVALKNNDLTEIDRHFLANRSQAMAAIGYSAYLAVRADYQINTHLLTGGSLRYFNGSFSNRHAIEQKAWLETLFSKQFGLSVGYALSWAQYNTSHSINLVPMIDLCWYLGYKKGHEKGLFNRKMF